MYDLKILRWKKYLTGNLVKDSGLTLYISIYIWWYIFLLMTAAVIINPLSANPTKWSNTLKQFVGFLPTNCLSLFDHFVGLAHKGLTCTTDKTLRINRSPLLILLSCIFDWMGDHATFDVLFYLMIYGCTHVEP